MFNCRSYIEALFAGSSSVAAITTAALEIGACARCSLRFAGVSREALYALADAEDVEAAVHGALPRKQQHLRTVATAPCVACHGLLAGRASVKLQAAQEQVFSAADKGAACSLGFAYGGAAALRCQHPVRVSDDWLADAVAAVAAAGYDLRGGVALEISVSPSLAAADERAYAQVAAAVAFAPRRLPLQLKDVLNSLASAALARLRVAAVEPSCVVLSVSAFEAAADAAAESAGCATTGISPTAVLTARPPQKWDEVLLDPAEAAAWPPAVLDAAAATVGASSGMDALVIDFGTGAAISSQPPPLWSPEPDAGVIDALSADRRTWCGTLACYPQSADRTVPLRVDHGSSGSSLALRLSFIAPVSQGAQLSGGEAGTSRKRRGRKRATPPTFSVPVATPLPSSKNDTGGNDAGGDAHREANDVEVGASFEAASEASQQCVVDMTMTRASIYVRARYNKFARGLSQSPWFIEGQRIGSFESSVEELIAVPVAEFVARATVPTTLRDSSSSAPAPRVASVSTASTDTTIASRHARIAPVIVTPPLLLGARRAPEIHGVPQERCQWRRDEAVLFPSVAPTPGGFKFHTAGREDVDVRMLGPGRPCVIELLDCRSLLLPAGALAEICAAVNNGPGAGMIALRAVAPATREEFAALQTGAAAKRKRYTAMCWSAVSHDVDALRSRLGSIRDLKVAQLTPMRVLHRRSLATRMKTIHALDVEELPTAAAEGGHVFLLHIIASAGTYIKEFVHGDRGRTRPNIRDLLGCDADILTLDVTGLVEGIAEGDDDSEDE